MGLFWDGGLQADPMWSPARGAIISFFFNQKLTTRRKKDEERWKHFFQEIKRGGISLGEKKKQAGGHAFNLSSARRIRHEKPQVEKVKPPRVHATLNHLPSGAVIFALHWPIRPFLSLQPLASIRLTGPLISYSIKFYLFSFPQMKCGGFFFFEGAIPPPVTAWPENVRLGHRLNLTRLIELGRILRFLRDTGQIRFASRPFDTTGNVHHRNYPLYGDCRPSA